MYFINVFYVVRKPLTGHLFFSLQISAEFMCLVSTDLHQSFFDGLDKYVPTLLEMYRVRSSSSSDLRSLLQPLDVQVRIVWFLPNSLITIPQPSTKNNIVSLVEIVSVVVKSNVMKSCYCHKFICSMVFTGSGKKSYGLLTTK